MDSISKLLFVLLPSIWVIIVLFLAFCRKIFAISVCTPSNVCETFIHIYPRFFSVPTVSLPFACLTLRNDDAKQATLLSINSGGIGFHTYPSLMIFSLATLYLPYDFPLFLLCFIVAPTMFFIESLASSKVAYLRYNCGLRI